MKRRLLFWLGVIAVFSQAVGFASLTTGGWTLFCGGLVVFQLVVLASIWFAEHRA